ncbi:tetratricopeptide repeat protein [uncultured Roseibium sp.]|uniref:tetratricopeptide repeat protein n=1 Tax=uncultured Roseibium sp. TaxID=1936171 RepID=UPI0032180029
MTRFLRYLPVAIGFLSVAALPGEGAAMGLGRPEPIMGPHAADPGRLREVIELGSEQIVPPPTREQAAFISRVCTKIEAAAQAHALPPAFLARLIWTESRFDPDAISPMGAEGIAQFMPSTAKVWGLEDPFEPMTAITASANLLGHLWKGYGNAGLAAAAYNAGEKRVDAWLRGRSGLPGETRGYVYAITGHSANDWKKKSPPDVRFVLDEARDFQEACNDYPQIKAPAQRRFANRYFNRGLALTAKKDYEAAILRYTVAIRLKPNFPDAYNNRGIIYRKTGDYEAAILNYDAAIRLKPTYAAAYNNRGYAKRKLGRFEEAIADYDRALKLKPGYAAAFFNRGFAYAKLGQFSQAIADYSQAIKAQPGNALAVYNRALAYLKAGQNEKALSDLDKVIAANDGFARAYFQRATLLKRLGKADRAKADYREAVALNAGFARERFRKLFD